MWEFLQAYWPWIVFGLFFLWMMRMHAGGGGGCGMGHSDHRHQGTEDQTQAKLTPPREPNEAGGASWEREREKTPAGSHSGGCH